MTRLGQACPWAEQTVLLALHVLDAEEEDAVARHVRSCPACRATVDEAEETFAAVGETAATPPPAQLRSRILAATADGAGPRTLVRAVHPAAVRQAAPRRRWVTAAAAAVLLAGLVGGGIAVAQIGQQHDAATVHAGTMNDLLRAIVAEPHAVLVDRDQHPVAAVALKDPPRFYDLGLPAPDPGRTWVLWGMRGRAATALGAVPPGSPGATPAVPVGRPGEYEAYVLTQEAAGPAPARPGEPAASGPVVAAGS